MDRVKLMRANGDYCAPKDAAFSGDARKPFPACGVTMRGGISLPGELDDVDEDAWPKVVGKSPKHRVLGHDFADTEGEIEDREIVLLALGSDDLAGMEWGDVGNMYFVIDAKALAKRNWKRVRVVPTA